MNTNNTMTTANTALTEMLKSVKVTLNMKGVKSARSALARNGAVSQNLSDETAVAANALNNALTSADASIKTACCIAGALRLSETWKTEKDDAGKPFKSENAFLKAILPGYATSTVSLYADTGATIYLPIAAGKYPELAEVANLGPSNAKFLLSAFKDDAKRAALPAAIKEVKEANNGKLTQKAINSVVKKVNGREAEEGGHSTTEGEIANDLSGGAMSMTVKSLIQFAYNGDGNREGDLTAIVFEKNIKDFTSLLLKARNDSDTALAFCEQLYSLVNTAK